MKWIPKTTFQIRKTSTSIIFNDRDTQLPNHIPILNSEHILNTFLLGSTVLYINAKTSIVFKNSTRKLTPFMIPSRWGFHNSSVDLFIRFNWWINQPLLK